MADGDGGPRGRSGFTIVEMLVVVVIIALLIGLLLPAVQQAREAMRRTQCVSNQKQLALAAMTREGSDGCIPGWRQVLAVTSGTINPAWSVTLLPHIEKLTLFNKVLRQTPTQFAALADPVEAYRCPSGLPPGYTGTSSLAYAGNCGSASNVRRFDGVMLDNTITTGAASGVVSFRDVAAGDGATQTLLFSEKSNTVNQPGFLQGTWNTTTTGGTTCTFSHGANAVPGFGLTTNVSTVSFNPVPLGSAPTDFGLVSQPSSNHPGGVVVAFCDGSVRFLADTISPAVYAQLLSWDHTQASGGNASAPTIAPYRSWITSSGSTYQVLLDGDLR